MKKQKRVKSKSKITMAIYTSLTLCIFSFVFSIFGVINTNDLRFEKISKLSKIEDLSDQNEKLEIGVTKLKTAQNLKESALNLGMVEVSGISYVTISGNSNVAINNR
jgi:cell division protein FtsB